MSDSPSSTPDDELSDEVIALLEDPRSPCTVDITFDAADVPAGASRRGTLTVTTPDGTAHRLTVTVPRPGAAPSQ